MSGDKPSENILLYKYNSFSFIVQHNNKFNQLRNTINRYEDVMVSILTNKWDHEV